MCGINAIIGPLASKENIIEMVKNVNHRGPDFMEVYSNSENNAYLGHTRLKVIDLSNASNQPMTTLDGRFTLVFNGEIYNYIELKEELKDEAFHTNGDVEVVLKAFVKWGMEALNKFNGMFSFVIWDDLKKQLFAARDRFGVKPMFYTIREDTIYIASEIKSLFAAGIPKIENEESWSEYLSFGTYPDPENSFWKGIYPVPAGNVLRWNNGEIKIRKWYDFVTNVNKLRNEHLSDQEWIKKYKHLLSDSVNLRFRSDVAVGVNLSGGLDSGLLLGLISDQNRDNEELEAYTFITGDVRYDELPWVEQMINHTDCSLSTGLLRPDDIPDLATKIQKAQDEPYGGFPTIAYSNLFKLAREKGTTVVLDGQGLDEQWAGYSYYQNIDESKFHLGPVQGSSSSPVRPNCLIDSFRAKAKPRNFPRPFNDLLRDLQYRDIFYTKIPRALRFNDRISMMYSIELREPFLDYRLVEMAVAAPSSLKIRNGEQKWLLRRIAEQLIPKDVAQTPKRPLQTPQREWLKEDLQFWANEKIELALKVYGGRWLDAQIVRNEWKKYQETNIDNSFFIWQWINLGLWAENK